MTVREWLGFGVGGGLFYAGDLGWWDRAWNATRWRIIVSGYVLGGRPAPRIGRHRVAYRDPVRDVFVYALPPLHLLLRAFDWYRGARWTLERRLHRAGVLRPASWHPWNEHIAWWDWPFTHNREG